MGDTSRPPGLDMLPGLGGTSTSNQGPTGNQSATYVSVGRGTNPQKSNNQQKGPQSHGGGRGKKNSAKQTSSTSVATQGGPKSANLASFGEKEERVSESVRVEVRGGGGKRGGRETGGRHQNVPSSFKKQWVSGLTSDIEALKLAPTCLTCCEPIEFFAVGECNHVELCGLCTIRRRQIYKEMDCCICKQELEHVVVDASGDKKFEELWAHRVKSQILPNSTITINDHAYFEWCKSLFERHCPQCEDGKIYSSLGLLKKHVEHTHGRVFCDLCLDHRKCFLHEQRVYQGNEIAQHNAKGDASIQLKPHPSCEYCSTVFFSIEDLFKHCEEVHFKCFLCERENLLYHYFKNYDHLDRHFVTKHFACREKDCLEKKFVVFATALDLQAHNISAHRPQEKGSAKSARVVHLDFSVEGSAHASSRRTDSQNSTQGRNGYISRPAMMPIFNPDRHRPSSAAHQSHGHGNSHSSDGFALQGKFEEPKPVTTIVNGNQPSIAPVQASIVSNAHLSLAERSKNLIATIKAFLNNDSKFNKFRSISADYRNSKLTAQQYYAQFIATFGEDAQVAQIFDEMVTLLPDSIKQAELRSLRETDPKATPFAAVGTSAQRSTSNPHSMASIVASGGSSSITRLADSEAFPSLPGASTTQHSSSYANSAYHARGSGAATSRSAIQTSEEAFPSLPGSDGRHSPSLGSSQPKGQWGNSSAANSISQSRGKNGGKKGKQSKQFINLY